MTQVHYERRTPIARSLWPLAVFCIAVWFAIVLSIDPAGSYPSLPEGPGLTVDEIFNVQQGVYLVSQARALGWINVVPGTSLEAFRPSNGYLPDHPPLGRFWLGLHHELTWLIAPPHDPDGPFVTACARTGSATAFVLTLFLIGLFATCWWGRMTGMFTAISLVLMPRVFGHAHLASLETITNLTCTVAVLAGAHLWNGSKAPSWRACAVTGALFGLALLTKIQAILIPVPFVLWSLWRWRLAAIVPLGIWTVTALVVFMGGWPYLWFDTTNHLMEYLGRTTNRMTLSVWYFGTKYTDKDVPWHYPFVIFGLTVPVALHLLGIYSLFQIARRKVPDVDALTLDLILPSRARDFLLLGWLVFPLILFALPGIAVYDCERLFLTSFPIWAMFIGRGFAALWTQVQQISRSQIWPNAICAGLLIQAGAPLYYMAPCHLCYYNEVASLVLGGADPAGLDVDYWGVGVTRSLLKRIVELTPKDAQLTVTPTLHHLQADDLRRQSPILRKHGIKTIELPSEPKNRSWTVYFRRKADFPVSWIEREPSPALAEVIRSNSVLARFVKLEE